jgi:hypothetical protein
MSALCQKRTLLRVPEPFALPGSESEFVLDPRVRDSAQLRRVEACVGVLNLVRRDLCWRRRSESAGIGRQPHSKRRRLIVRDVERAPGSPRQGGERRRGRVRNMHERPRQCVPTRRAMQLPLQARPSRLVQCLCDHKASFGRVAMLAAIRRASSRVSTFRHRVQCMEL